MRIIILVDMDAFYASCELVRKPNLKGKPVVVGADPNGRGVVSACNYEARKFGLHSGMPIAIAYRKCPNCVFLPVDMEYYVSVSNKIMKIMKKYADKMEQVSVDEAFLDVSSKTYEKAKEIARKIKTEILKKEKVTCSIGIGPNKLIAKIASSKNKPNGLTIVQPSGVQKFLDPLDVDEIYMVGPKTTAVLNEVGIETIKQLRSTPKSNLIEWFGEKFGHYLYNSSRGIDDVELVEEWTQKSIGRQYTFEKDTTDKDFVEKIMDEMTEDSFEQLRQQKFKTYKTVTIKVRYEDFSTFTKAKTLIANADSAEQAKNVAKELLNKFFNKKKIRLIGISLGKLK
ncbi:MAG: DNA polymerase IV [Nanoarchaeota archaeon]